MEPAQADIDSISDQTKSKKAFYDELTKIAIRQLSVSNRYKEPLVAKWKEYQSLKAGNVKRKLRVQFNVALPVFQGMLDTLAADFDEPIELRFKPKHPSDYFKMQKIQSAWDLEKAKYSVDARWDFKARVDKSLNILHGRSFLKEYASSYPKYHNVLGVSDPLYMHTQPQGGGLLENHLYAGEEAILRTESELAANKDVYDQTQVKELITAAKSPDYLNQTTEWNHEKLQRFTVLGLNPENNDYVGESTFNLVEWVLMHKGKRHYLLFDPWTGIWVRGEVLKDVYSKDLYPWTSWATHEDNAVFWTMSYADIIYPVADAIVTLYNQELTSREKQNMHARAYDKDAWPDVAKLDEAQYRPDALVPFDSKGGTRKVAESIYEFKNEELNGTIELLDWTIQDLQKNTGITDVSQGVAMNAAKKVNVAYMEQASVAKRLGYKSQSYTEAWGEIGVRYIQGLQDHMSEKMFIEILGDQGIEPDVLTREDLDLKGDAGVEVVSSTAEKAEAKKKKDARIEAIKLLMQDQNINSEWRTATVLSDIGEYSEADIKLALDTKNYAARESVAKAHICIQELLQGKEPMINYSADAVFMKIIFDYIMDHRNKLGVEKSKKMAMYIAKVAKIASDNAKRNGTNRGMQNKRAAMQQGMANGKPLPMGAPQGQQPIQPAAPAQPEMAQVG